MLLLAVSLLFVHPEPLELPRAEAYQVREDGVLRLEDRYDAFELWQSRAVLGRWSDEDGRVFTVCALDVAPPPEGTRRVQTRVAYTAACRPVGRRANIRPVLARLSPCPVAENPRPPRQMTRGYKDIDYWQMPTNYQTIVCAFRPERVRRWYLATWELAEGDDYPTRLQDFEREFLVGATQRGNPAFPATLRERIFAEEVPPVPEGEREQLRADAHHSVTNYATWHVTDAPEFTILDALASGESVRVALTNDLHVMRRRYAEVLPTPIDGSNVLCVARVFADRADYLLAVDDEMSWTAAYWNPARRELVAYLPPDGAEALVRTFRHEAFHQYLSYAASMISVSPWLNEGYAEYFEHGETFEWGKLIDPNPDNLELLSKTLPALLLMDYTRFYEGTDRERAIRYQLAWSIAYFLEKGAPEVRFKPFKNVKHDYFETLLRTQDMREATAAAFRDKDTLQLFVREWLKFWKDR